MAFSCLADFGRKFSIGLNTVFLFLALAVLVIGALVKYGKNTMGSIMDAIVGGMNSMDGSPGLGNFDLSNIDIGAMIGGAAVAFIIAGIALMGVAAFGIYGAKKKLRSALIMYTVLITAIMVAELAFIIIVVTMRKKIDGILKEPMKTMLTSRYTGINGSDVVSKTWNFLMLNFHCCGVDDFADFRNAVFWDRKYKVNSNTTVTMEIPITCCKSPEKVKENQDCLENPNKENSNFLQGCYEALWSEINNNSGLMIGIMASVVIFELLLIYFAVLVAKAIAKENKEKRNERENKSDNEEDKDNDQKRSDKKNKRKKQNKENKPESTNTSAVQTVADVLNKLIIEPQLAAQGQGPSTQQTQHQNILRLNSILGNLAGVGDGNLSHSYPLQNIQHIPNVLQPFAFQATNSYLSPVAFPAQAAVSQLPNVQALHFPVQAATSQNARILNYPFVSGNCVQSNMPRYVAQHGSTLSVPPGIVDAVDVMCTVNNDGFELKQLKFESDLVSTPPPPYSGRPSKSSLKRVSISDDIQSGDVSGYIQSGDVSGYIQSGDVSGYIQSGDISGCACKRKSICTCIDEVEHDSGLDYKLNMSVGIA